MAYSQHTTIQRDFKHLALDQRGMIAAYHDSWLSTRQIGERVGCDHTTVSRELRRGRVLQRNSNLTERYEYFPDAGQRVYRENLSHCNAKFKLADVSDFLDYAQKMMRFRKWAPDIIVGEYKINPKTAGLPSICTKTLYHYIDKSFMDTKNIDLLLKVRRKVRKEHSRKNKRILGESIENRPSEVATRETFNHWEIDTVIGKNSEGTSLLTLLERKSRVFLIRPLKEHTADCVNEAIVALQKDYGDDFAQVFQTITADNGSEFYGLSDLLSRFGVLLPSV